jgi:A/G-specific adenine glycosylase
VKYITTKHSKSNETLFVRLVLEWSGRNKQSFPWREGRTPYKVLLAEILLQRTPANRVSTFFPLFVERFPGPKNIASTNVDEMEEFLQPMGLKKRAEWLVSLMKEICEKYNCKVPDQENALRKLPGVGRYTARAVLSFGFKRDVAIVDVNVARVLSRVFGILGQRRPSEDLELWDFAVKLLPRKQVVAYNEALLDFAMLICKKQPLCSACPLTGICNYYQSSYAAK